MRIISQSSQEHAKHVTTVICRVNVVSSHPAGVPTPKIDRKICSAVARILHEERGKKDISLNALAAKAGLSYQIISYVEREMRIPKLDTLVRITSALGIELSEVIKRAERSPG
jgi:ribosome-binding protein aMBF1 (putative translation factor)